MNMLSIHFEKIQLHTTIELNKLFSCSEQNTLWDLIHVEYG